MKKLLLALLFAATPVMAVDFGQLIDLGRKAVDTGKKVADANRDLTVPDFSPARLS